MSPASEHHYRLLEDQNNELEHMCSLQAEEIEKLQADLSAYKKKLAAIKRAGERLHAFIDELICADLIHDELLDKANKVADNWEVKGR